MQNTWAYTYLPSTTFNVGVSISTGDVNMDGLTDMLACIPGKGAFDIYYGVRDGFSLSYLNDYNSGGNSQPRFCSMIANIGDFNNANGNDVIVSVVNSQRLNWIYNTGSGLSGTFNYISFTGVDYYQYIRGVSDVNGDGISDYGLMTGNANGNIGYIEPGNSNGDPVGFAAGIVAPTSMSFQAYRTIKGLGKFNTDNYNDFIITIRDVSFKYGYVFYGSLSYVRGYNINLSSAAFTIKSSLDFSGYYEATSSNINNDSYNDLFLLDTSTQGLYIYFGGSARSGTINPGDANIKISTIGTYNYCFKSIAGGSDYNSDGYQDIVIGCEPTSTSNPVMGVVVFGSSSLATDNIESLISQNKAFPLIYDNTLGFSSFTPVLTEFAKDFNGDGYGDVVVSYSNCVRSSVTVGGWFVFFGASTSYLQASQTPIPSQTPSQTPTHQDLAKSAVSLSSGLLSTVDIATKIIVPVVVGAAAVVGAGIALRGHIRKYCYGIDDEKIAQAELAGRVAAEAVRAMGSTVGAMITNPLFPSDVADSNNDAIPVQQTQADNIAQKTIEAISTAAGAMISNTLDPVNVLDSNPIDIVVAQTPATASTVGELNSISARVVFSAVAGGLSTAQALVINSLGLDDEPATVDNLLTVNNLERNLVGCDGNLNDICEA